MFLFEYLLEIFLMIFLVFSFGTVFIGNIHRVFGFLNKKELDKYKVDLHDLREENKKLIENNLKLTATNKKLNLKDRTSAHYNEKLLKSNKELKLRDDQLTSIFKKNIAEILEEFDAFIVKKFPKTRGDVYCLKDYSHNSTVLNENVYHQGHFTKCLKILKNELLAEDNIVKNKNNNNLNAEIDKLKNKNNIYFNAEIDKLNLKISSLNSIINSTKPSLDEKEIIINKLKDDLNSVNLKYADH